MNQPRGVRGVQIPWCTRSSARRLDRAKLLKAGGRRYNLQRGDNFRLGAFHDLLISYGSRPLSDNEWLMFDDHASVRAALN